MSEIRVRLPSATSLVARSAESHVIGRDNRLPWHLRTDLKKFRQRTEGHVIIMGRRTFESIGRPLPNRTNIVLSRSEVDAPGVEWASNVETALLLAETKSILLQKKDFFVIGGEQIYTMFLPYINKVFLTEVHDRGISGDARFDVNFGANEWDQFRKDDYKKSDFDEYDFSMICYMRKINVQRTVFRDKFLKSNPALVGLIEPYLEVVIKSEPERQLELESV
ncbi:dihydrofolate reductase [Aureimonas leprariae]|uniref:dihydrofolate reductase n=1 Tax=Plantimonas leprariae TaxID=2615207 RepID=UPI0013866211|nr:dihydrofolate reductase [Aureimonas leprariae]